MRASARALVALTLLAPGCKDADTIIAVWRPAAVQSEADAGPQGGAGAPDASLPPPAALYLEAEDGLISGAFAVVASDAASNGALIVATEAGPNDSEPGMARAVYSFTLETAGDYVIWGRIHSPTALNNRYWVEVDGGTFYLWRISTGDAWYWDDIHNDIDYGVALTFPLTPGPHTLTLANAVTGAELDRLYITALADHPPGNTTPCNPPHSIELGGRCVRSCGSYGNVSCIADECVGRTVLEAYDCAICCSLN